MFLAQANNPVRFETECGSCHGSAEAFIRKSIVVKIGKLTGVASGISVREFLQSHRDLQQADVEFFTRLFTRVLNHISRS